MSPRRASALAAPARMRSHATSGCRLSAAKRVIERLTTTHSQPGAMRSISSAVASSPVTSAIGTP